MLVRGYYINLYMDVVFHLVFQTFQTEHIVCFHNILTANNSFRVIV
jgi:hypothetical protein